MKRKLRLSVVCLFAYVILLSTKTTRLHAAPPKLAPKASPQASSTNTDSSSGLSRTDSVSPGATRPPVDASSSGTGSAIRRQNSVAFSGLPRTDSVSPGVTRTPVDVSSSGTGSAIRRQNSVAGEGRQITEIQANKVTYRRIASVENEEIYNQLKNFNDEIMKEDLEKLTDNGSDEVIKRIEDLLDLGCWRKTESGVTVVSNCSKDFSLSPKGSDVIMSRSDGVCWGATICRGDDPKNLHKLIFDRSVLVGNGDVAVFENLEMTEDKDIKVNNEALVIFKNCKINTIGQIRLWGDSRVIFDNCLFECSAPTPERSRIISNFEEIKANLLPCIVVVSKNGAGFHKCKFIGPKNPGKQLQSVAILCENYSPVVVSKSEFSNLDFGVYGQRTDNTLSTKVVDGRRISLKDCIFKTNRQGNGVGAALLRCSEIMIKNSTFRGLKTGIRIYDSCTSVDIEECKFENLRTSSHGIYLAEDPKSTVFKAGDFVKITKCNFAYLDGVKNDNDNDNDKDKNKNGGLGILMNSRYSPEVRECTFESFYIPAIAIENRFFVKPIIESCKIKNHKGRFAIEAVGQGSPNFNNIEIESNQDLLKILCGDECSPTFKNMKFKTEDGSRKIPEIITCNGASVNLEFSPEWNIIEIEDKKTGQLEKINNDCETTVDEALADLRISKRLGCCTIFPKDTSNASYISALEVTKPSGSTIFSKICGHLITVCPLCNKAAEDALEIEEKTNVLICKYCGELPLKDNNYKIRCDLCERPITEAQKLHDEDTCGICLSNCPDMLFSPCGHQIICHQCAASSFEHSCGEHCPYCYKGPGQREQLLPNLYRKARDQRNKTELKRLHYGKVRKPEAFKQHLK